MIVQPSISVGAFKNAMAAIPSKLVLICDLDGTLLPRPHTVDGKMIMPKLSDGVAQKPIEKLLNLGATIIGVTGSKLSSHQARFALTTCVCVWGGIYRVCFGVKV